MVATNVGAPIMHTATCGCSNLQQATIWVTPRDLQTVAGSPGKTANHGTQAVLEADTYTMLGNGAGNQRGMRGEER